MRIRSPVLLHLAAVLLAAVAATYAANWVLIQDRVLEQIGSPLLMVWVSAIPIIFLLVAFGVLFQRLRDRNAWLMALMFCGFVSLFNPSDPDLVHPGFMIAYRMTLLVMAPGLFAFFFLVFPARSALDERLPWLKWLLVGFGACLVLTAGPWRPLLGQPVSSNLAGETILSGWLALARARGLFGYLIGGIGLGILALIGHATHAESSEVRRKAAVLTWGTVAGIAPALLIAFTEAVGRGVPNWLALCAVLAIPLLPLSFAYAVVKHRVMAIPVLVRRGARYLLVQRGLTVVSVLTSVLVAVGLAILAQRWLPAGSDVGVPVAVIAAGLLGVGVARTGQRVERRITDRIDRAFFPDRYEARRALEELAARTQDRGGPRGAGGVASRRRCSPRSGRCPWPSTSKIRRAGWWMPTCRQVPAPWRWKPRDSRNLPARRGPRSCPRPVSTGRPTTCTARSPPCGRSASCRWSIATNVSSGCWRWEGGRRKSRIPART